MRKIVSPLLTLVVCAALSLIVTPVSHASGFGRTVTYFDDGTHTNIVGQEHFPELGCENDSYAVWGADSNYRFIRVYDMCGVSVQIQCGERINGSWVPVDCPADGLEPQ